MFQDGWKRWNQGKRTCADCCRTPCRLWRRRRTPKCLTLPRSSCRRRQTSRVATHYRHVSRIAPTRTPLARLVWLLNELDASAISPVRNSVSSRLRVWRVHEALARLHWSSPQPSSKIVWFRPLSFVFYIVSGTFNYSFELLFNFRSLYLFSIGIENIFRFRWNIPPCNWLLNCWKFIE